MNGKAAKRLRRAFGTGAQYRKAKDQVDSMPTSFAQRPKLVAKRAPKKREPSAPTWPLTDDQKQQSRPLIFAGPRSHTARAKLREMQGKLPNTLAREAYGMIPKWLLDRMAILHPKGA